jgi:hypothetical protein
MPTDHSAAVLHRWLIGRRRAVARAPSRSAATEPPPAPIRSGPQPQPCYSPAAAAAKATPARARMNPRAQSARVRETRGRCRCAAPVRMLERSDSSRCTPAGGGGRAGPDAHSARADVVRSAAIGLDENVRIRRPHLHRAWRTRTQALTGGGGNAARRGKIGRGEARQGKIGRGEARACCPLPTAARICRAVRMPSARAGRHLPAEHSLDGPILRPTAAAHLRHPAPIVAAPHAPHRLAVRA